MYDDEQNNPTLGFGIIEEHQNDDVTTYKAVMLKKILFSLPEDTATTRGQSVEWQTKSIEGNVQRSSEVSENGTHPWKESADFAKESEAIEFLKEMLGVNKPDPIIVTSVAGISTGETKISVSPEKSGTNTYKYQTAEKVTIPDYNADCTSMTDWDGTEEITATNGNEIVVVECTAEGKAVKSGKTTVIANGG